MVPWSSVIFSAISTILALGVPVAAAIWFWRRTRVPFTTILIGALTFFVMQILLRTPLLLITGWAIPFDLDSTSGLLVYSGFLAITAAIFEEFGRLIFFKLFRRQGDWKNAVAMGIGHGGIESIILVGLTVAVNTVMLALLAMDLPMELPAEVVQEFTGVAPAIFLTGGIERILVLPVHIAFSILVVAGAVKRQWKYMALAIAGHTLLNFPVLWITETFGIWATELYILGWSIAAWIFIFRSRSLFQEHPVE